MIGTTVFNSLKTLFIQKYIIIFDNTHLQKLESLREIIVINFINNTIYAPYTRT